MAAKTAKTNGKPAGGGAVTVYVLVGETGPVAVGLTVEAATLDMEERHNSYGGSAYATPLKVMRVRIPYTRPAVEDLDLTPPAAPARAA